MTDKPTGAYIRLAIAAVFEAAMLAILLLTDRELPALVLAFPFAVMGYDYQTLMKSLPGMGGKK